MKKAISALTLSISFNFFCYAQTEDTLNLNFQNTALEQVIKTIEEQSSTRGKALGCVIMGQGNEGDRRVFARATENREAKIAPLTEGQNVTRDTIQVVRCKDRAACGFSFYSHARPDYQHVAEILGPHFKPVAYHHSRSEIEFA